MDALNKLKQLEAYAKQRKYSHPLRPRQRAAALLTLKSREERQAALERVPEKWRSWVEYYLTSWWPRRTAFIRKDTTGI